jgi:hypothetical protein
VAAPSTQRPPYLLARWPALAVFALYAFTLAPTTAFWDTSEYIATSHIMGIPHPPGNPLFVLLARAWDVLLAPTGLPGGAHQPVQRLHERGDRVLLVPDGAPHPGLLRRDERVRRVGAAVSVLVAATAYTVWNQSNVNEKVYTVSMFTIAALSWLAFLWRDHVEEHRGVARHQPLPRRQRAGADGVHPGALGGQPPDGVPGRAGAAALRPAGEAALATPTGGCTPSAWCSACWACRSTCSCPSARGCSPVINEAAQLPLGGLGAAQHPGLSARSSSPAPAPNLTASLAREQYSKPPICERQAPFWAQMANFFQYFDWQWARSISGARATSARPQLSPCSSPGWAATGCGSTGSATARASCTGHALPHAVGGAGHLHELQVRLHAGAGAGPHRRPGRGARARLLLPGLLLPLGALGGDRAHRALAATLAEALAGAGARGALVLAAPICCWRSSRWCSTGATPRAGRLRGARPRLQPAAVGGAVRGAVHQRRQRHLPALVPAGGGGHPPRRDGDRAELPEHRLVSQAAARPHQPCRNGRDPLADPTRIICQRPFDAAHRRRASTTRRAAHALHPGAQRRRDRRDHGSRR